MPGYKSLGEVVMTIEASQEMAKEKNDVADVREAVAIIKMRPCYLIIFLEICIIVANSHQCKNEIGKAQKPLIGLQKHQYEPKCRLYPIKEANDSDSLLYCPLV